MKVALTVWDGRISPVFDVCREALILTIESAIIVAKTDEAIDAASPFLKIQRLVELGVETVICGAISTPLQQEMTCQGVKVLGFVAGEIDEVVQAFLAGALPGPSLAMPGCYRRQRRLRKGQCHGHGRGPGRHSKGR